MRLPERPFAKPLPRALIEQRRNLALDANAKDDVLLALDALTIAPERFIPETNVYLGLRSIYWQLARAETDDGLRDVVARLWSMAVFLEDGNVSETEKQLRAAQDALREALERGASDEEIKKLMDDLRAALDKFMQALAGGDAKEPADGAAARRQMQQLRSQDLRAMLDRMGGCTLRRQGRRQAVARSDARHARKPADGAAERRSGRRRRHAAGARRARRHDPQTAAVARPHLPPGPGPAPPAAAAGPTRPAGQPDGRAPPGSAGAARAAPEAARGAEEERLPAAGRRSAGRAERPRQSVRPVGEERWARRKGS